MRDVGGVEHIQSCDLEENAVKITFVLNDIAVDSLFVLEASAHVIVGHLNFCGLVGEKDWSVFTIIGDVPDAGGRS